MNQAIGCLYRAAVNDPHGRTPVQILIELVGRVLSPEGRERFDNMRRAAGLPPQDARERDALLALRGMIDQRLAELSPGSAAA